jgi:plastocyanin
MLKRTHRANCHKLAWFFLPLLSALVLLAACGSSTTTKPTITPTPSVGNTTPTPAPTRTSPEKQVVNMLGNTFSPATLTIPVGSTVTWKNKSLIAHTVTSSKFDSRNLLPGGTFSFTFKTPGTFQYVCNYHPFMQGTIMVT